MNHRQWKLSDETVRYTVEWHSCGQPRPYADSVYEFTIFSEWIPYGQDSIRFVPSEFSEDVIKPIGKAIRNFHDTPREWHMAKLVSLKQEAGQMAVQD